MESGDNVFPIMWSGHVGGGVSTLEVESSLGGGLAQEGSGPEEGVLPEGVRP